MNSGSNPSSPPIVSPPITSTLSTVHQAIITPLIRRPLGKKYWHWVSLLIALIVSGFLGFLTQPALAQEQTVQDQTSPSAIEQVGPIVIVKKVNIEDVQDDEVIEYTIVITNVTQSTIRELSVSDPLPDSLEVIADSIQPKPSAVDAKELRWQGILLDAGQEAIFRFQAKVKPPVEIPIDAAKCPLIISNTAYVSHPSLQTPIASIPILIKWICPDLGDAPDSSNHAGAAMTAYPTIGARYPTVYDLATGVPPGPRHRFPKADAWLGPNVSGERDADQLFDQDGSTNLRPATDVKDQDKFDDGILRLPSNQHCVPTTMDVLVTVVGPVRDRFLNVWNDWNRDGDWEDRFECQGSTGAIVPTSEWSVRNQVLTFGPGVYTVTTVSFLPVWNANITDRWMRVTLSEIPAPINANNYNEGFGPPFGYRFGETEDFIVKSEQPGEPHLVVSKQSNVGTVLPGGIIQYTLVVSNTGTGPANGVLIADPIPVNTTYVAGSVSSVPAGATYNGGPNRIEWTGNIPAGGSVTITFQVQVSQQAECNSVISNKVNVGFVNGGVVGSATVDVKVICEGQPHLTMTKKANVTQVVPGGQIEYTIVIANTGTAPASGILWQDPIPSGTTYVAGSLTSSLPTKDDSNTSLMKWTGSIPASGSVTITFKVTVSPTLPCPGKILNKAGILGAAGNILLAAEASVEVICPQGEAQPDFGDAPDSDNNHGGGNNTAYAGPVLGHFPSVWDGTPAGQPSGPKHNDIRHYWLGNAVTAEKDADLLPDADGITNILNGGDNADNDKADEGWLNPDALLDNCREATLKVRVSKSVIAVPLNVLYLNVWIDGNRDGDWQDRGECPGLNARSFEWIVQNHAINPVTIPAGGFIDIAVPTVLVHNIKPNQPAWLRFTLSEQKAVPFASTGLGDGRGPDFPSFFRIGETEDYIRKGTQDGQPGEIGIQKKADPAGAVNVGDLITYTVVVNHAGGTAAASTMMTDVLPVGVSLVGAPMVTELVPNAAPLVASYNPGIGPNGAVLWSGSLTPNAAVQIQFVVRVRECVTVLRNVAVATKPQGGLVEAKTENSVNCQPVDPQIKLTKSVLLEGSQQQTTGGVVFSGSSAIYYLTLSSNVSQTVLISDNMPTGVIAVATSASSGVANIINAGQTVVWTGVVGPGNSPVTIKIQVRIEKVECDQKLVNIAKWITRAGLSGESNPVTLVVSCRDLGDAPDSTNHAGVKMSAYPGVQANYPTVFDVASPERGPMHLQPRPFHLGQGVTVEEEADQGMDADGVNNILPSADKANLDKADDGGSPPNFHHCVATKLEVKVSIDPIAMAQLPNGVGYLNVWVDSNRDGDWADRFDCPQTAGTAGGTALEHIVIDFPVNTIVLGAGLHTLSVPTGLVAWPDSLASKPAWLRATLSEKQSNKPFTQYGDGRGYDDPFRLGETEDYLLPGLVVSQDGSDVNVSKRGEIWPDFNPENGQRRWVAGWIVNYANLGSAAASNLHVIESYDSQQTLLAEHSIPLVPHTQTGNTLDYNVGNLPPGGSGLVIIRTAIPWNTTPGTVIQNSATVSSTNDGNTLNNSSTATVTVPILPPVITSPLAGSTCTNTVVISGVAQPGVTVDLYIDGALASSLPTSSSGDWGTTVNLAAGSHNLHAIARLGSLTSDPSPTVMIIVDPTLFWNPISLRFVDELGHVIIPSGRLDESGWSIFLRPGHTYTVSVQICCQDENAQVTLQLGENISLSLTDPDGDRIFTATFTIPIGGRMTGSVRICVTCQLIRRCSDGQVTIDPEGVVYDITTGAPIAASTVSCLQANDTRSGQQVFALWNAAAYDQINPQTVGADGHYSFYTPAGTYRVDVRKSGYQPHISPDLVVVDSPAHYDVPLTPIVNAATGQQIAMTDSGFEPSIVTVLPGTVIEWINAGTGGHGTVSTNPSIGSPSDIVAAEIMAGSNGWSSGLLQTGESYKRQLYAEGTYTYSDPANPNATATIIVKGQSTSNQVQIFLPVAKR